MFAAAGGFDLFVHILLPPSRRGSMRTSVCVFSSPMIINTNGRRSPCVWFSRELLEISDTSHREFNCSFRTNESYFSSLLSASEISTQTNYPHSSSPNNQTHPFVYLNPFPSFTYFSFRPTHPRQSGKQPSHSPLTPSYLYLYLLHPPPLPSSHSLHKNPTHNQTPDPPIHTHTHPPPTTHPRPQK